MQYFVHCGHLGSQNFAVIRKEPSIFSYKFSLPYDDQLSHNTKFNFIFGYRIIM